MSAQDFLVEIGTEELPPKALKILATAFADNIGAELAKQELNHGDIVWYAAPRRLAVRVNGLAASQSDKVVEKRGPSIAAAFDADGKPTKAAAGWAAGCGISVEQAERLETDKGAWLLHKQLQKGQQTVALLADVIKVALAKLPIARPMRWGNSDAEFIRPVHTIVMLYGSEVVPATILGRSSSNKSYGHRFHAPALVEIANADAYLPILQQAYVVADYHQRKATIAQQVKATADSLNATAQMDDALLEEVASLVEWPVILVGSFEQSFLQVPAEPLISTMKDNQKYFPLLDKQGKLINKFIFVTNIESKDPQQIISGNEKVVRPRLADAEFFFKTDRKTKLIERLDSLKTVLFQQQLGTLAEKSERISSVAGSIAVKIGADQAAAKRAGLLSKTDLMSNMVGEFPEVQGIMGMHYARLDGEDEAVALALNEQYMPRFAGDQLPSRLEGAAVAIADKLDTLVGIFGIGQIPKGDKDPFALRRAAIGALRIMVEKQLPLDLVEIIAFSQQTFGNKLTNIKVADEVLDFMLGRFRAWYQDEGYSVDVIQAVLARRPTSPSDFDKRVSAVAEFSKLDAAAALAAANKRVANILAKVSDDIPEQVSTNLLQEPAEIALHQAINAEQAYQGEGHNYSDSLAHLAGMRGVIDSFFDQVMVNADDNAVRFNRLALLKQLRELFLQVADISVLQ
ncbi:MULTISPECIES: glycine--tRNA ligase subunit beta [unclassified Arsukibacterium]|uniref:glycine--tRNA ligase subunit beta n=1 Tax=unclassified Arsukibacterium TaxID=2635278 RepID=UPI000C4B68B0|nr:MULTISPECIES: glycine--tRNA ligase subunit beta [unclassified Arsukibacterium]MAA93399.1 glycine--tRNA ligase subunit beta [Rheinheimera sp.]MBM32679.1 glycine--tRNA ligase subunit beta [Rheinheimera sp.]HAW92348.1 glycine--tRNA ligase subunit beta [Candidatus Azambacteria bacterium]|tara:strand:- start:7363 stop:9420 length:2058 start_codon:yes stop_codon:yes gene_type:complete